MNTRFEFNIKKVGIRGDDAALYILYDEKVVLKARYKDIESLIKRLLVEDKHCLPDNQPQPTIASTNDDD